MKANSAKMMIIRKKKAYCVNKQIHYRHDIAIESYLLFLEPELPILIFR